MTVPPAEPPVPAGLAEAVAARICHDLVSPVGALVNGADLLAEISGADTRDEIAMMGQSAARAAAVLAFHRLAFGAAGVEAAPVARASFAETVAQMLATPRVEVLGTQAAGPALPRPLARAGALAALCARSALGMGGRLRLALGGADGLPFGATAEGADPIRIDMLRAAFEPTGAPAAPDPRRVEFALLPLAAAAAGARLALEPGPDRVALLLLPG